MIISLDFYEKMRVVKNCVTENSYAKHGYSSDSNIKHVAKT